MCGQCVMLAASAATGARSWLATRRFTWMTPRRLKLATAMLIVAAFIGGSLRFSGSTPPPSHSQHSAQVRPPGT
jgi:hypothetical protein